MDLRQLAALVAVSEQGTFSAAAGALHTVQSNVSAHIARLERELGATLIDRAEGTLTAEGEIVLDRARRVQSELDAMLSDVSALRSDVRGPCRLGMIGTTASWLVPHLLRRLGEEHPGVYLTVVDGISTALEPQLGSGRLDLAVVTLPVPGHELTASPLFDEDLVLVAPSDHVLARRALTGDTVGLTVADLDGQALLLPAPGTVFRSDIDQALAAAGASVNAIAEMDGVRLLAFLAFEGHGPAVVPATAVPTWLGPRSFETIPVLGLPRRHIGIASRRRGLPSAATRAVADVIRDVLSDAFNSQPGVHPPSQPEPNGPGID